MNELKGRHVAAMFVSGFAVIIAVNLTLAANAVRSFPGLEVANSYIASQSFEARRDAQDALGWSAMARYDAGRLTLSITNAAGDAAPIRDLTAHVGRPTEAKQDLALDLSDGAVDLDLSPGLWRLDVAGTAPDGTQYEKAIAFRVAG